ncbi:MAG: ThuA domain-containing protein [Clostridia bacterium]
MRSLLFISNGRFHPPPAGIKKAKKIINGLDMYRMLHVRKLGRIKDLDLAGFDCLVLFFHVKENIKNTGCIQKIVEYVNQGGNVLSLHGSTASFKGNKAYTDMLGSIFLGHDKVEDICIAGFVNYTVRDELYHHALVQDCEVALEGNGMPIYWKRRHHGGRVACFIPGHRKEVFDHPETTAILLDALHFLNRRENGR